MIKVTFEYTTVVKAFLSSQDERNVREFAKTNNLSIEEAFQTWVEKNKRPTFTFTTSEEQPNPKRFTKIQYDGITEKPLDFEKW